MMEDVSISQNPELVNGRTSRFKRVLGKWAVRTALITSGAVAAFGGITATEAVTGYEARAAANPFDAANGAEKAWCRWPSRWSICNRAQDLANESLASAQSVAAEYGRSIHNGDADAYRHCYWSGRMTQEFGWETARGVGERHEYNEGQPVYEQDMDLYNNRQGRIWAQQTGDIGQRCLQGMLNGELQIIIPFAR